MDNARQIARLIVSEIVSDLSDRRGLDNEWDAIDSDVKKEIELIEKTRKELEEAEENVHAKKGATQRGQS